MPLLETLRLAVESLTANKLRAGLTMLGMIIGVAAVVLLVSIGQGAKNYITSQFESLGSNVIFVQPGKTEGSGGLGPPVSGSKERMTLADVDALEKQATNIQYVTGVVFGTAAMKSEERTKNGNVLGVNENFVKIFNFRIGQGEFITREEDETGRRVVVLGAAVARQLFPNETAVGRTVKVNDIEHRVVGVMSAAGQTLGFNLDEIALIPTQAAMRVFNTDRLFGMRLKAKSRVSLDDAIAETRQIFMERNNGVDDVTIFTQASMLDTMNTILNMLAYALAGIAFISLLVGGIGIMNIMLVSVTERTREIGIRRAVGARQADVLRQFLAEAISLSMIGGLIGLALSTAITWAMYLAFPSFDMRAPIWILIPAFVISSAIGIGFGVWPARKAARIETIEALRYE